MLDEQDKLTPVAVSGPVTRESRSGRRHIRARMPVDLELDGARYRANDISIGGFGIEGMTTVRQVGESLTVSVLLPFRDYDFKMTLTCEVAHIDRQKVYIGFRFVDITETQVALLGYLIQSYLSGELVTVENLLSVPQISGGARAVGKVAGVDKPTARQLVGQGVRYVVLGVAGLVVMGVLGLSFYDRFFTVDAELAALTAPRIALRAPADGRLVVDPSLVGRNVEIGTRLFAIRDPDVASLIAEAEAVITKQQAKLVGLQVQLRERRNFFKAYSKLAAAQLAEAEATLHQARIGFETAEREYFRTQELREAGHATVRSLDDSLNRYAQAKAAMEQAAAAVDRARTNEGLADQGQYYTNKRGDGGEIGEIRREIQAVEAEIVAQRERVAALQARESDQVVVSPCNCLVQHVRSVDGDWVAQGEDVTILAEAGDSQVLVSALVDIVVVDRLRLYQRAHIAFADRDQPMRGRIVAINRTALPEDRLGLPPGADGRAGVATILVMPDQAIDGLPIGLPAQVTFPLSWRQATFRWLGGLPATTDDG